MVGSILKALQTCSANFNGGDSLMIITAVGAHRYWYCQ